MPKEIWFKNDLKSILFSINVASAAAARLSNSEITVAYRQGFEEAINTVAIALDINPRHIVNNNGALRGRE